MAGLIPPSSGSVVLQGKPVMGPREDIGMMFQQTTLFPWRTVMENVVLPIEIRDGKKAARAAHGRARALLSRSEEHTSELQSLIRTSFAVFCLKKKKTTQK